MDIGRVSWEPPDGSAPLDGWRCRHGEAELIVVPERGGKIVSLRHMPSDSEWLWLNPHLAWRVPDPRESFVALHDVGGWDECFPTVAPTTVAGRRWPDHGDLWWRPWHVEVEPRALVATVEGDGYRFSRRVAPSGPSLALHYEVENRGSVPLPYLWCAHPLFRSRPSLAIELLGRPEVRLGNHSPFGAAGERFLWPTTSERSFAEVGKPSAQAVKLFIAIERGWVALQRPDGLRLEMAWSAAELPILGLWVNEGGWSGAGTVPYHNLGVEPGNGAPDDLAVAIEGWECYCRLEPGQRHRWSLALTMSSEELWPTM